MTGTRTSLPEAVRPACRDDVRALSLVLARAFRSDPVHRWILPGELDWALASDAFFAMVLREALRDAGVYTDADLAGAAVWFTPCPTPAPLAVRLWNIARWFALVGRRASRVGSQLARLERTRPPEPHWYLAVLGTDPHRQGRGVGSALLAPVLARCDADRIPAHLESSKIENVPFYERHGFRVVDEFTFRGGPTVWCMHRECRA